MKKFLIILVIVGLVIGIFTYILKRPTYKTNAEAEAAIKHFKKTEEVKYFVRAESTNGFIEWTGHKISDHVGISIQRVEHLSTTKTSYGYCIRIFYNSDMVDLKANVSGLEAYEGDSSNDYMFCSMFEYYLYDGSDAELEARSFTQEDGLASDVHDLLGKYQKVKLSNGSYVFLSAENQYHSNTNYISLDNGKEYYRFAANRTALMDKKDNSLIEDFWSALTIYNRKFLKPLYNPVAGMDIEALLNYEVSYELNNYVVPEIISAINNYFETNGLTPLY